MPLRCGWHWLAALCLALSLLPAAQARSGEFRAYELVQLERSYVLNTSIDLELSPRVQELIDSGLSVPFRLEFVLTRGRWYWLDETIVERALDFRLSYHALTRQYRLTVGSIHRSFAEFDDALRAMLSVRNWAVLEPNQLRPRQTYQAALRFRLDITQLPKPFQVAAFGDRELDLNTGWVSWKLTASE